jgi:hypothetical protein
LRGGFSSAVAVAAAVAGAALAGGPPAKLTGAGEVHRGEFGWSIALAADGRTAAVGAPNDDSPTFDSARGVLSQGTGAVWVYARSGSRWRQVGPKLVGRGGVGPAQFGADVALSGDGRTLAVGAPADSGGTGAVWVFTRAGSGWRSRRLAPPGPGTGFGTSVALSDSGRVALVGGAAAGGGAGAAWIYARRGTSWVRSARLRPPGEAGIAQLGKEVALSGSGTVALVGAPGDEAAWVFVRRGGRWAPLPRKLSGNGTDGFGRSVALSRDGTTALVGAPVDGNGAGAAWLFRVGGAAGKRLTAGDERGPGQLGDSVALSANGQVALVGGALDDSGRGAAWRFGPAGPPQKLRPAGIRPASEFGNSVALSGSGAVALVGSVGDRDFVGSAWLYG